MASVNTSGSVAPAAYTAGTEYTIVDSTSITGALQCVMNLDDLEDGQWMQLRIYGRARSTTDTQVLIWVASWGPLTPAQPLAVSPALLYPNGIKFTMNHGPAATTEHTWEWAIYDET